MDRLLSEIYGSPQVDPLDYTKSVVYKRNGGEKIWQQNNNEVLIESTTEIKSNGMTSL